MTRDVIRSFNRDTAWLATGVLGALVLAALMLAVEEHESKAMQAGRDFLVNANPATMASVIAEIPTPTAKLILPYTKFLPDRRNPQLRLRFPLLPPLLKKIVTHLGKTPRKRQHQRPAM